MKNILLDVLSVTANVARRELRVRLDRPLVATVTIDRPRLEVHARYRRLQQHLASCLETSPCRIDFEIVEDRPGEVLAWRSRHGNGRAVFTPVIGREATELRLELGLGLLRRKLLAARVQADLLRLKDAIESVPSPAAPRLAQAAPVRVAQRYIPPARTAHKRAVP